MKIYAFHLLNDYSGSHKVLSQLLKGWVSKGFDVTMVTCKGRVGFLSSIEGVKYQYYRYKFRENKWIRLFNLLLSQCILILKLIKVVKKDDIVYVNTVLPFGAAILGRLKRCRVVYHVHETTMKPKLLKVFLFGIVKLFATDVIYVSNFLSEEEPIPSKHSHVIHNALEKDFLLKAESKIKKRTSLNNVLMVCSLKDYKGVKEYLGLAKNNFEQKFRLIVNATDEEISSYFFDEIIPSNFEVLPTQTNLHDHYYWSDIILNLSRPDGWVETFGLTIIEGMAYGLPAIVPPVGGVKELVDDGINGYQVDSRDEKTLNQKLRFLVENPIVYRGFVESSLLKVKEFDEEVFINKNIKVLVER